MTGSSETTPDLIDGYKERIMAKFTAAQIEEHAKAILESFADGFQWTDIIEVVPRVMEIVEDVSEMSGEEKGEAAGAILDYVIDNTDTPWLPDSFIDPILKKGVRALMPLLCKASKGELKLNSAAPAEG